MAQQRDGPVYRLLVAAERDLRVASRRLVDARPHLARPIRTAEAKRGLAAVGLLEETLSKTCESLGSALSAMAAVGIISVSFLDNGDEQQQQRARVGVGVDLRPAIASAEAAHYRVVACRGHLAAAALLAQYPGVPRVDAIVDAARLNAAHNLEDALRLTAAARKLATGGN